jgi:hypothetical protein
VARAAVTSGANCGGPAACVLFLAHPDSASKTANIGIVAITLVLFI